MSEPRKLLSRGKAGVAGAAGAAVRSGAGAPSNGTGNNGDFWIDTTNSRLYGPKASGAWPGGYLSLIGATGAAGAAVLNGAGAPSNGSGSNGDFWIDTTNTRLYGPKASGAWPGGYVSLIGAAGSDATVTAANTLAALESMDAGQQGASRAAIGATNSAPELFHDFTLDANGTVYQDGSTPIVGTAFQLIGEVGTTAVGNTTTESAVTAGSFSVGEAYVITTVGTTNYTPIGASANTVGVVFRATGVGSGTGTATPWMPALLPNAGTLYYLDCTLASNVRNFAVEYVHKAIAGGVGAIQSGTVLGISPDGSLSSNLIHIRLSRNAVNVETGPANGFTGIYSWALNNNKALPIIPFGVPTVSRIEIHDDTLLIQHEGRTHTIKHANIEAFNGPHIFVENTADGTTVNGQVGVLRLWGNAPDGFFPQDSFFESIAHGAPKMPGRGWFGTGEFAWITGSTPTQQDNYGVATPGAMLTNKGFFVYPVASTAAYPAEFAFDLISTETSCAAGADQTLAALALFDFAWAVGKGVEYVYHGVTAANANNKRIKLRNFAFGDIAGLGAGVIFDSGDFTDNAKPFRLRVRKRRTTSHGHVWFFEWQVGSGTPVISHALNAGLGGTAASMTFLTGTATAPATASGDLKFYDAHARVMFH